MKGKRNYNKFFKYINAEKVNTVFEVGSKDCLDGVTLMSHFNSEVHCFECNPQLIKRCENNIKGLNKMHLCTNAIADVSGETLEFTYPIQLVGDSKAWDGIGSLNGKLTKKWFEVNNHPYQKEDVESFKYGTAQVESLTLEDYCKSSGISQIDLICFDVEGVTLRCIKGLGEDLLNKCSYIISEVNHVSAHDKNDDDLFSELNQYLIDHGFELVWEEKKSSVFGNAIWENKNN